MGQIGFLGAGRMGSGIAANLLKAGHSLRIHNRTRARAEPLIALGAEWADTPRAACEGADIIFSMVGDDAASKAMWRGEAGALAASVAKDCVFVECSTLSRPWVIELAADVEAAGYHYIDCPVTGLPEAAAAGELVLFLGAEAPALALAEPYLEAISSGRILFGGIGAGTVYKLIVNLMGSIQIAATAEALLTAEKAGLDLDAVAEALGSGGSGSPAVRNLSRQMVAGDHEGNVPFAAEWRLKDTLYGVELANALGQPGILGDAALGIFQRLVDAGHGSSSESKLIDLLRMD